MMNSLLAATAISVDNTTTVGPKLRHINKRQMNRAMQMTNRLPMSSR